MDRTPTRRDLIAFASSAGLVSFPPANAQTTMTIEDSNHMDRTDVSFDSAGMRIAGHLYCKRNGTSGPRPAVIVGHPGSGVKEQAAGLYARRLAEHGFVTLAFDAAYTGESAGEPRGLEDPAQRIEDIKSAVSFMSVRSDVDPARIGLLGVCASGGYVVSAMATDSRVRALAMVSGVDIGTFFRRGHDGKQDPALLRGMLENAAEARTAAARGEGVRRFPIFHDNEAQARAAGRYVFEGWEYYCTARGEHPRAAKSMPWISVDKIAAFDGFSRLDMVAPRPLLMIVGSEADTKWIAQEAYAAATDQKELFWIDGASHVDLYDKDEFIMPAVEKLAEFFTSSLG